jgi:ubiquilin
LPFSLFVVVFFFFFFFFRQFSVRTDTEKNVGELKAQVEVESKIPAAQQRLIYSGKVLKDSDKLADVGIKDGVSIHLVKGASKAAAASPSAANSGSAAAQPAPQAAAPPQQQQQQQMPQANPFAAMFGGAGMAGAGAGMGGGAAAAGGFPGLPPGMDLQQVFAMMQNPAVQQMMNQVMSNPALMQAMMANNPMLQQMAAGNPMFAQAMQDPQFMNSMFAGGMPGAPPAGAAGGAAPQQPDLNALLQNLGAFQAGGGGGGGAGGAAGGAGDLAGLLAALGGQPAGAAAQNSAIPPEQRFANQLDQLGEMGFVERDRCVAALLATNGNVPAAVERLLSGLN